MAPTPPVDHRPAFLSGGEADALLAALLAGVPFEQRNIRIAGRSIPQPRLTAWQGEEGAAYTYSGLRLAPAPFHPAIGRLKPRIEEAAGAAFNSVLLNLYRDGRDSIAWHSDDEAELGPVPVVASLSLGAARRFDLRRRDDHRVRAAIELGHGALLVMRAGCQAAWQHRIAKVPRREGVRVNLTFRRISAG